MRDTINLYQGITLYVKHLTHKINNTNFIKFKLNNKKCLRTKISLKKSLHYRQELG